MSAPSLPQHSNSSRRSTRILLAAIVAGAATLILALGRDGERESERDLTVGEAPSGRDPTSSGTLPGSSAQTSGAARAAGALRTLRGAVVLAPDMAPVPEVRLFLGPADAPLATAVSDADGRFELELDARRMGDDAPALDLVVPRGVWLARRPELDELASGGARVVLAPLWLAPFRGRVRDAETGEPVPEFLLRVNVDAAGGETLVPDAQGRFRSRALLAAGEVAVLISDPSAPGEERSVHPHAPAAGRAPEVELRVEIGPTYSLRLELPAGLELHQFGARLFDDDGLRSADLSELEFTPLRLGERPWVRLSSAWWLEAPAWLVVRSDGGGWVGKAQVAAVVGRQATPVEVRLERRVRVLGRVLDAEGEPAAGAFVSLAVEGELGPVRSAQAAGNGAFVLRGVPAGACRLQARHERAGEVELALVVDAASPPEPVLRLEPYTIGGDVAGVVRSTSGRFDGFVSVALEPLDPDRLLLARVATIEWREELGALQGEFRFEAVATGRYRLRVRAPFAPYRCDPELIELGPPAPGLEVLVLDEVRAWCIRPMVWSASTGYLRDARITARVRGQLVHDGPLDEWPRARRFRADEGLEWSVSAPGHRTVSGDLSDLDADADRAWRRLRVELDPLE